MLSNTVTVLYLATLWLVVVVATGPSLQLEPEKEGQKDINIEVTAATTVEKVTAATTTTDEISELEQKMSTLMALIQPLGGEIKKELGSFLDLVAQNVTATVEALLQPLFDERLPGVTPARPAASCSEIQARSPLAPPGYYWMQDSGGCPVQRYCAISTQDTNCSSNASSNVNETQPVDESLGGSARHPARSCADIRVADIGSPSGYYWLRAGNGSGVRTYCDMTRTCGGITGGWMQVANIDMTDSSHTCPQGLRMLAEPGRMCEKPANGRGCASAIFDTRGMEYTRVCGKIIGYQYASTNAFKDYNAREGVGIDEFYMDGVVLTHGSNSRQHIWSFAAAVHEHTSGYRSQCPCMNEQRTTIVDVPAWVGNSYFCDTGAEQRVRFKYYLDDPLWDGEGCGPTSTCCSFNDPPWFSKQLPSPTTDDIEMRLCVNKNPQDEDLAIEKIVLYVQ